MDVFNLLLQILDDGRVTDSQVGASASAEMGQSGGRAAMVVVCKRQEAVTICVCSVRRTLSGLVCRRGRHAAAN